MIESTYGDSHPGSGHLNVLVDEVRKGIAEENGFGARYYCTDICDGESQGTDGINYSLASREMIANMIEIHANATPFDAGVYLSSCDKGVPGNLMGSCQSQYSFNLCTWRNYECWTRNVDFGTIGYVQC